MSSAPQPQRLHARDAASAMGVAPSTLAKFRVFGGGPPYIKIGRRVVYDRVDLETWLSCRKRRSTTEPVPTSGEAS